MNVILSVVHDMEYEAVAPFLKSLAAADSDAKVHFFVCGVSVKSIKKMEAMGVVAHPFRYLSIRRRQPMLWFWPVWRRMMAARDFEGKCALGKKVFHLFVTRFVMFYEFLQMRRDEFRNVLLTDCRDVYFQRDPFSDHLGPGVHCFLEAKTQIIGTCPANSRMIDFTFGPEVLAEMAADPVSCAGTTIGDVQGIMGYLKGVIETIAAAPRLYAGSDQGAHNLLIHYKRLEGLQVHDNYNSTVFTAGCEPAEAFRTNVAGEIIRDDGKPYPILHQYDRNAVVREKLREKVGL